MMINDELKNKIKTRGKIQLIVFEDFKKRYHFDIYGLNDFIDIIIYKNEKEIIKIFEDNIDNNEYFNVIFFKYDNKEDASNFLKLFVESSEESHYTKGYSEYPFFVFFKTKDFSKEILYSYYLEKEITISRYYQLRSYNIKFINKSEEDIIHLISKDIKNYFYEFDFKSDSNEITSYKIEMIFLGQTGCGKSTFINYLLGKLKAFSASMYIFKSLGGIYTHTKYPLSIKDPEGFEMNSQDQEKKIFDILEKNIKEELNNRTHIALYLIPGPFNVNRDLDYSCIGSLLKLEEYNIHYYLIMTKDPDEGKNFCKASIRFLNGIIIKKDFNKIKTDIDDENKLISVLEKIKDKLKDRIFSVDCSKMESKTIGDLLNKIYDDLKADKMIFDDFIKNYKIYMNKDIKYLENIIQDSLIIKTSNFLLKKIFKEKREQAYRIINEANDVSSLRKLFFSYNSKMEQNRIKMLREISLLYKCKNLNIDILENIYSDKEKNEFFCNPNWTEELGKNIINICEEEYKKLFITDKYLDYCINFSKSIDLFGKYIDEFLNFKLNGKRIPYDCELIPDKI